MAQLYADENFSRLVVEELRRAGQLLESAPIPRRAGAGCGLAQRRNAHIGSRGVGWIVVHELPGLLVSPRRSVRCTERAC